MLKKWKSLGCGLLLLLPACQNGTAPVAPTNASSLEFCAARNLYSEAQLSQNPSLYPTFDDAVLVDLEKDSEPAILGDSSIAGRDVIHYRLSSATSLDFNFQSEIAESVSLEDSQGTVLATLTSGQSLQDFPLAAGDYFLNFQSKNLQRGTLVVQPSGCSSADASASTFLRASLTTDYSHPGVYITELPNTQAVTPSTTSVTAFVGAVPQGPLNLATSIESFDDYTQTFGALNMAYPLGLALLQFFEEGGSLAYVVGVSNQPHPSSDELVGSVSESTGLYALEELSSDWDLLVMPDLISLEPSSALEVVAAATQYVNDKDAFFIQDPPAGMESISAILAYVDSLAGLDLETSAIYFPYLQVENPVTGQSVTIGAGGTMAGVYAQTDIDIGVWAAPANQTLLDVEALSYAISDPEDAVLNPKGINAIRAFANRGIVVWGAKTLSQDLASNYVQLPRLSQFLLKSARQNLQWVVFQANDQNLWGTVVHLLSNFMDTLWQAGAFAGDRASDAYYIICDSSNNTPESILNGYLNVTIAYAPIYPGEFEVIQLTLVMAD